MPKSAPVRCCDKNFRRLLAVQSDITLAQIVAPHVSRFGVPTKVITVCSMVAGQVLTVESGAALEAGVIDALPYIDGITSDDRQQAEELIEEEVSTFRRACRPVAVTAPAGGRVKLPCNVFS